MFVDRLFCVKRSGPSMWPDEVQRDYLGVNGSM